MELNKLTAAREQYEGLDLDTIPLKPGSKLPAVHAWQRREPYRLWRRAPDGANVGIRAGNGTAVLDCDDRNHPGTFENIQSWLAGLGYLPDDYPVVQTASGVGRHVYANFSDELAGDFRHFSIDFGAGEFRYGPGAYVVAPPSVITNSGDYVLIGGDFRQRPRLTLADVTPVLSNTVEHQKQALSIPRHAQALLFGNGVERYATRSEGDHAIVTSLVNAGHSFESVMDLFMRHPCAGKFAELRGRSERSAIAWLRRSYEDAKQWAESHESKARQIAQAATTWAQSTPWHGRTGAVDRAVFLAHASIAYRAGQHNYAASSRELAERAGTSHMTATTATHRLIQDGLLSLEVPAVADCANIYAIGQTFTLPKNVNVRKCKGLSTHDVFRWKGLGKSAAEVWEQLQDSPLTVAELAERTGRHIKTVKRALVKMSCQVDSVTGEIIQMVERDGEKWHALEVDLDHLAEVIGTAGTGRKQREKHMAERKAHGRTLELGKTKEINNG